MPNLFQKIFSGGAGQIVESVGNVADKFVQTKEEKDAANLELRSIVTGKLSWLGNSLIVTGKHRD